MIGTQQMHKYGESTNDSTYDGSCTSCHFRGGTYEISGRFIVVDQRVHCESLRADTVWGRADWTYFLSYGVLLSFYKFYIRGSVHRNSRLKKSNEMQQYADIYLLLNYSTCFGRPSRPSSGVHKNVVATSGTDHTIWGASFLKHDQIRTDLGLSVPNQSLLAPQIVWSVPEAATAVLCTPDDGRDGRPKHVE